MRTTSSAVTTTCTRLPDAVFRIEKGDEHEPFFLPTRSCRFNCRLLRQHIGPALSRWPLLDFRKFLWTGSNTDDPGLPCCASSLLSTDRLQHVTGHVYSNPHDGRSYRRPALFPRLRRLIRILLPPYWPRDLGFVSNFNWLLCHDRKGTWPTSWFIARHVLPNPKYHVVAESCLISVTLYAEKDFDVISSHFSQTFGFRPTLLFS